MLRRHLDVEGLDDGGPDLVGVRPQPRID